MTPPARVPDYDVTAWLAEHEAELPDIQDARVAVARIVGPARRARLAAESEATSRRRRSVSRAAAPTRRAS